MIDIVERLRMAIGEAIGNEAADELESLRQRVAELEGLHTEADTLMRHYHEEMNACERELAALKAGQGEPVAFMFKIWDGARLNEFAAIDYEPQFNMGFGWEVIKSKQPLYTAPTIPEGWVIVPVEPTDKMREFICDCYCDGQIDTYRSMLAAAPKPEE